MPKVEQFVFVEIEKIFESQAVHFTVLFKHFS